VTGRRLHEPEIIERVNERLKEMDWLRDHPKQFKYTVAGHDCWSDIRARVENVPTSAEQYAALDWPVSRASVSRIAGLKNFRAYLRYGKPDRLLPLFRMFETETNLRCFEQLQSLVVDPDDREDVLKQNADDFGEGGDDLYDETRYALASRPVIARPVQPVLTPSEHRDTRLEKILESLQKGPNGRGSGGGRRAPLR
jgi:hypothetical protein